MPKSVPLQMSESDRLLLMKMLRSGKTERRMHERARVVLMAAEGRTGIQIASMLKTRPARVSKWTRRYRRHGLAGIYDLPRSAEKRRKYSSNTEQRILAALDEPVPAPDSRWNGELLAKHLGDVSVDYVWRVLRKHKISLQRQRSWCVSTDPEFAPKAADIVGLYLSRPENAVVLCIDEKPCIQALEREQGWVRMPNGRALLGHSHDYIRHGTTTLFAALNVATGQIQASHFPRRRRREFLQFMNEVIAMHPGKEVHVVLDNLNTHKPKNDRWLARHRNVSFHYTPTYSSWLNQVECWFSILSRKTLKTNSFHSVQELKSVIDAFIDHWNENAHPFEWTKTKIKPGSLKRDYAHLRK